MTAYNYPRFKVRFYQVEEFTGPKAGELFPNIEFHDIEGAPVRMSDYRGKWVVLETGSVSCPQYIVNIPQANDLAKKYPSAEFLLLYVREAHPGGRIPAHGSIDEKRLRASSGAEYNEGRRVLVDDLEGSAHTALGSWPNLVYVINPEGRVVFRSDWNVTEKVGEILSKGNAEGYITQDHFEPSFASPFLALKVIGRAGFSALVDFFAGLPQIAWMHIKKGKSQ